MQPIRILVVDDEKEQRELVAGFLSKNGFEVIQAENGEKAIDLYKTLFSPVALVDMKMPGMNGLELIKKLKEINPFIQIIMLTAFGSVESAVSAMKAGASDYLTKPVEELDELLIKLQKAAEQNRLIVDNKVMTERLGEIFAGSEIIGESIAMSKVREMISLVGPRDATVLVTGPSGTGKELVARAIHALSSRADKRLVAINCAAFPETLLESELFGHEKGAFTGADRAKQGRFELADGGTLFLDEIGDMPMTMQVKLLRVLEERSIQRLGSVNEVKIDIRIIAATNRDLEERIKEGTFREDLFYRLNVIQVELPSLAEREGDVLLLAGKFLDKFCVKIGKKITGIDHEAASALSSYGWPGNVRELENVIERAVVLSRGDQISRKDLPGLDRGKNSTQPVNIGTLAEVEKGHIETTLMSTDWNFALAAEKLGIHRNTLRTKIKEYKLERPS